MQISNSVYYRFEPEIKGGTLYIYNRDTKKIIKSQKIVYEVLRNIDKCKSRQELLEVLQNIYSTYSYTEIESVVEKVITNLKELEIISDSKGESK